MVNTICFRLSAIGSLLLLYAFWPRDAEAVVVQRPEPGESKQLEFFHFVMLNDLKFRLVLDQPIRIDKRITPPYQNDEVNVEVRERLRLFSNDVTTITPFPVLKKVLTTFWWLGSLIDYAARVLQEAFMCTTFTFVSLQMELIIIMEQKLNKDADSKKLTNETFEEAWRTLAVFMDKLGAVHSDLDMLADLSYEYTELKMKTGKNQMHVLRLMRNEIDKIVNSRCVRKDPEFIYRFFDIGANHSHFSEENSTHTEIFDVFINLTEKLLKMYEEFNITSINYENWVQILDFRTPVEKNINLYLKIDELLKADDEGKHILKEKMDEKERVIRALSPISRQLEEIQHGNDEDSAAGTTATPQTNDELLKPDAEGKHILKEKMDEKERDIRPLSPISRPLEEIQHGNNQDPAAGTTAIPQTNDELLKPDAEGKHILKEKMDEKERDIRPSSPISRPLEEIQHGNNEDPAAGTTAIPQTNDELLKPDAEGKHILKEKMDEKERDIRPSSPISRPLEEIQRGNDEVSAAGTTAIPPTNDELLKPEAERKHILKEKMDEKEINIRPSSPISRPLEEIQRGNHEDCGVSCEAGTTAIPQTNGE